MVGYQLVNPDLIGDDPIGDLLVIGGAIVLGAAVVGSVGYLAYNRVESINGAQVKGVEDRVIKNRAGDTLRQGLVTVESADGTAKYLTPLEVTACGQPGSCSVTSTDLVQRLREAEKTGIPHRIELRFNQPNREFLPTITSIQP